MARQTLGTVDAVVVEIGMRGHPEARFKTADQVRGRKVADMTLIIQTNPLVRTVGDMGGGQGQGGGL